MRNRFQQVADKFLGARKKIIARQEFAGPITEVVAVIAFVSVIYYIFHRSLAGQARFGDFISFIGALAALQQPIKKLQDAYVRLQQMIASTHRIFEILEDKRVVPELALTEKFPENWDEMPESEREAFAFEEDRKCKEGIFFYNNGLLTYITGDHYFYLNSE